MYVLCNLPGQVNLYCCALALAWCCLLVCELADELVGLLVGELVGESYFARHVATCGGCCLVSGSVRHGLFFCVQCPVTSVQCRTWG